MTEQTTTVIASRTRLNGARQVLIISGATLLAGGGLGVYPAIQRADRASAVEALSHAVDADNSGFFGGWHSVTANYTWAWVAGGLVVLGVIMLIAAFAINPARSQA